MALTRKGSLAFGIGSATGGLTAPTVTGVDAVQSAEVTDEYTVNVQGKDANGETVAHVYGDAKATMRVEGLHTAASLPSLGSGLTVGGKAGVVMRATVQASNEDFVRISVEGEKYNGVNYA
jgi:hypothetical protein